MSQGARVGAGVRRAASGRGARPGARRRAAVRDRRCGDGLPMRAVPRDRACATASAAFRAAVERASAHAPGDARRGDATRCSRRCSRATRGTTCIAPAASAAKPRRASLLGAIRVPALIVNGARDLDSRRRGSWRRLHVARRAEHHDRRRTPRHLPNLDAPRDVQPISLCEFARRHLPAAA